MTRDSADGGDVHRDRDDAARARGADRHDGGAHAHCLSAARHFPSSGPTASELGCLTLSRATAEPSCQTGQIRRLRMSGFPYLVVSP